MEKEKETMKITYKSSISSLTDVNSSFDSGVLRVCYTGDNRNGSSISREVMERCINTIYNCPIVCNYDRETDSIGEHDMTVVMKDGVPAIVNETDPIGVVPANADWWFEMDDDHEYLCVNVLLWKRQEAYAHIKENGITDESMEIAVTAFHTNDDGILVIDEFEFNAFCLLESAEPCYEGASLAIFSIDRFRQAFSEMIEDLKNVSASLQGPGIDTSTRKEEQDLEKEKILAEFGLTAGQLGIEDLESCTEEDLRAKCEEFSLTAQQLSGQILEALCSVTYTDEWGTWNRYNYVDHDVESHTVYAVDTQDDWNLYGLSYAMNGDTVVIDFSNPVRKKVSYVDFDEGDTQSIFSTLAGDIMEIGSVRAEAAMEAAREEFAQKETEAAEKIAELNDQVESLQQFRDATLAEQRVEEVEAVFAQFEDLNGVEAFEALKADYGEMTPVEIEDRCFSIRGRNMKIQFSKKDKQSSRIPAKMSKAEDEPYGGVFEQYPPHK